MRKLKTAKLFGFIDLFDKFIKDSESGKRLQKNGARISAGTIENYKYTRMLIKEFCIDTEFDLRIMPIRYLTDRQMVTEKNYWDTFSKKFSDFLYQKKDILIIM